MDALVASLQEQEAGWSWRGARHGEDRQGRNFQMQQP